MIEWKEYTPARHCEEYEMVLNPRRTRLDACSQYLVCSDKGRVYKRWWSNDYGFGNGDERIAYYAEINIPEGFEVTAKEKELAKMNEEIKTLKKEIEELRKRAL